MLNADFERKVRGAAVAGWWALLICAAVLLLQWIAYLLIMSWRPGWATPLIGPGVTWDEIQHAWWWGTAILKILLVMLAIPCLWLTLWSRELRRAKDAGRLVAEIKAADAAWVEAAASKSVVRMLEFYDDEAVFIGQDGKVITGMENLRAAWTTFFAVPGIALSWKVHEVKASHSRDLACSYGPWETEQGPPGQQTKQSGTYVFVWRKQQDGRWKVLIDKP
jgi:uncharacterized protein (TIGR02246 family)